MIVALPTFESACLTLVIALIRTIVEASPTILGGVMVAAWLRTQATPEKVADIFSGHGVQGSLRTVFVGMALPVCSIGVLPVLRELRSLGLPVYKLIVLALAAPLLNPFSLLFGLTVLSAVQYLMMIALTGLLAIVIGDVSSRFAIRREITAGARPAGLTGATRLRNMLVASSRLVTGRLLFDFTVTVILSALTLSFIQSGAFFNLCAPANRGGPAVASLLTLTRYVSPSRAIIQFGGIRDANLAVATGLVIYVFGSSISGATIVSFSKRFGLRRMLALVIAMFLVVNSVSYLSSYILPLPVGDVPETNAINNLTRPSFTTFRSFDKALEESLGFFNTLMISSGAIVAILFVTGLFVRFAKVDFRSDDPELAEAQNNGRMAKAIPASQLGAVAVCGIGILFFLATYIFYPSPSETLDLMEQVHLDARVELQSGNAKAASAQIAIWDSAAASIPVGAAIRGSFPSPLQRTVTRELRAELRKYKEFLDQGDLNSAKDRLPELKRLLLETKSAFTGGADG